MAFDLITTSGKRISLLNSDTDDNKHLPTLKSENSITASTTVKVQTPVGIYGPGGGSAAPPTAPHQQKHLYTSSPLLSPITPGIRSTNQQHNNYMAVSTSLPPLMTPTYHAMYYQQQPAAPPAYTQNQYPYTYQMSPYTFGYRSITPSYQTRTAVPPPTASAQVSAASRPEPTKTPDAVTKPIKKYVCHCSRSFTTSGHLARHMRIHTGEKKYCCSFEGCGIRFSRQDNCMQHYRTHLRGRGRKKLVSQPISDTSTIAKPITKPTFSASMPKTSKNNTAFKSSGSSNTTTTPSNTPALTA